MCSCSTSIPPKANVNVQCGSKRRRRRRPEPKISESVDRGWDDAKCLLPSPTPRIMNSLNDPPQMHRGMGQRALRLWAVIALCCNLACATSASIISAIPTDTLTHTSRSPSTWNATTTTTTIPASGISLSQQTTTTVKYNDSLANVSLNGTAGMEDDGNVVGQAEDLMYSPPLQILFGILYAFIFVVGIAGNVLVCYVVFRNKAMQTVTNYFITNLALSDILLCILAVPFTPLYTFLERWVFGSPLCHIVPFAQGCSVYISTLTLTAVAIDRFFVIVYPFQPRMKLSVCIGIIVSIWCFALLVTLPYGLYMRTQEEDNVRYCEENWPEPTDIKIIFSICTTLLQFAIPFLVITFCYVCVSVKLNDRARLKPGSKTSKREEADRDRKKRTNRMLIAMVGVFGISWLPLNLYNIVADLKIELPQQYNLLAFFISHALAMSSTCYNPFLYAWLNENFRKEFIQILPCLSRALSPLNGGRDSGPGGGGGAGGQAASSRNHNRSLRRCMGPTSTYDPDRLNDRQARKSEQTQSTKVESVANSCFNNVDIEGAKDAEQRLLGKEREGLVSAKEEKNNNHNNNSSISLNRTCDEGRGFCQRQEDSMLGGLCNNVAVNVLSKRTRDQQQPQKESESNLSETQQIPLADPVSSGTSYSCGTTTSSIISHQQTPPLACRSAMATDCQLSEQDTAFDTTELTCAMSTHSGSCNGGGQRTSVSGNPQTNLEGSRVAGNGVVAAKSEGSGCDLDRV